MDPFTQVSSTHAPTTVDDFGEGYSSFGKYTTIAPQQRMLDRAEQRSKHLGIANTQKVPLTETANPEQTLPPAGGVTTVKRQNTRRKSLTSSSPQKQKNTVTMTRHIGTPSKRLANTDRDDDESKENLDVGLEINITAGHNVQVQVEVEQREIDDAGNVISCAIQQHISDYAEMPTPGRIVSAGTPAIRDSSRNRLQRLGALYSGSETISSPVHKNEARFDEAEINAIPIEKANHARNPARSGKLAALASSINSWEDESSSQLEAKTTYANHRKQEGAVPKRVISKVANLPKSMATSPRKQATSPRKQATTDAKPNSEVVVKSSVHTSSTSADKVPAKQLKWDKNVMDSLEAQGFTRRESTTSKMVYDYSSNDTAVPEKKKEASAVKPAEPPKALGSIGKGLVSGRAAIFETGNATKGSARLTHKDPAEMSLKDRLALFEKNKGTALMPKAAFGMSASQAQISNGTSVASLATRPMSAQKPQEDQQSHKAAPVPRPVVIVQSPPLTEKPKIDAYNKPVLAESHASGNCIRNTVAALMNKGDTISAAEISNDIRKQREREMSVLLNRFNRPNNEAADHESAQHVRAEAVVARAATAASATSTASSAPPPPPPPPPQHVPTASHQQHVETKCIVKRKSIEGNAKQPISPPKTDSKRKKTQGTNRLYPVLSDVESTTTPVDSDNYTTATVSSSDELEGTSSGDYYQRSAALGYRQAQQQQQTNESFDEEDSYMDSEDADTSNDDIANISLGREILQAVKRNEQAKPQQQRGAYAKDLSMTTGSDASSANVTGDMDDYLDEALEDDSDAEATPRKGSISSSSFSFARNPPKPPRQPAIQEDEDYDTDAANYEPKSVVNYRNPVKSELRVDPSDDDNIVTLTHTVSFYRRQQSASVSNTPVRKVTYADQRAVSHANNAIDYEYEQDDDDEDASERCKAQLNANAVEEKVKRLLDEIRKQEQIMSQTSQALNLCAATVEFSGSTESVEGERHLLVASHRRQAALNEVQRLRVERYIRAPNAPTDRGRLTVKEITVPLRQEYKDKLNAETICGHQMVCLLKYNENVVATKTVPTLPGLLAVKFPDVLQLNNVYADFKITLEIYGMTAQREVVPHDLKYHINRKTPKGKKHQDSRLVMPHVQSPGGPGAVRTPALTHYGFVIFSLREIQRTNWTLNQASAISPLHGNVYMKANCELNINIDHNGFLTMFEDVAGFGAWHRRWCRLHGHVLNYWRYPDDEKTKAPMGSLDLKTCCTQKVSVAPRDVCARLNTMLLEIRRPCQEGDQDSLVIVRSGRNTLVRHLLSADTKDEREKWCAYFNKALVLVRSWGAGSSV